MSKNTLSVTLILIASGLLGCQVGPRAGSESGDQGPRILTTNDPLVPKREFPAWNPPKQMAIWVHPREDRSQGILLGGQWVLENLTEGGWYIEPFVERDPVPDAEATKADLEAARRSVGQLSDFVIPYRVKE